MYNLHTFCMCKLKENCTIQLQRCFEKGELQEADGIGGSEVVNYFSSKTLTMEITAIYPMNHYCPSMDYMF